MYRPIPQSPSNLRVFNACLLSFMILVAPLASVAASTRRLTTPSTPSSSSRETAKPELSAAEKLEAELFVPAPPVVGTVTASKDDNIAAATTVAPGDVITYDFNIANGTVADVTGLFLEDTIDSNTTLEPGSLKVSPLAIADTYNAPAGTPLNILAAAGLLSNDFGTPVPKVGGIAGCTDGTAPFTGCDTSPASSGTVDVNEDGSFTYTPPSPTFEGTATFTYTATNLADGGLPFDDTATVTISVDAPPSVSSTTPANTATQVGTQANISITFSEPVNLGATPVTISCVTSGAHTSVVSASPNTVFNVNPDTDFANGELCTVTVLAAQVTDADGNDPPDNMAGDYVFSFTIDQPPSVSSTTPTNGAANQITTTDITLTFSESVNLGATPVTISCTISGSHTSVISASPNTSFTVNPDADFVAGETCTVTVLAAQVTDDDTGDPPNNMAGNYVFNFSIDAAPTVNSTTPTSGATKVANNADLSITFSESVNLGATPVTISCATSGAHTSVVSGSPNTTFTVNPDTDFANGELCTVTVLAAQVTDDDANDPPDNMAGNYIFSFTIDLPPSVQSISPVNGATNVAVGTDIVITFDEAVDATTSSFTIECPAGSGNQAYALSNNGPKTIYTLNPTANLPAGAVCTVKVIAAQVTDTDLGDPPNNMTSDFTSTFKIPPVANADTYPQTVIGNVNVNSANIPYSVITNDVFAAADPVTITKVQAVSGAGPTITAGTANGGTVVMTTTGAITDIGKFTYNPPAGFVGNDTFTYEITNGGGTSAAATVTIPISGMVWFINNNSPSCTTVGAGCGRLSSPFSTLASFNAVNNDLTGVNTNPGLSDNIFIYQSATAYDSNITLVNGQKLIGQDSTSSLATLTGLNPPSGSAPFPTMFPAPGDTTPTKIITTTASTPGISLNKVGVSGTNVINGLTVGNTTGAGIFNNGADPSFGTLTVADVSINDPAAAPPGRTGQALSLSSGTVNGTFTNVTSTGSGSTNLSLFNINGTINLGTGTLSTATSNALSITGGGTAVISYAGAISSNGANRAVSILNKTGGSVALSGLITSSSGAGVYMDTNTGATMSFTGGLNLSTAGNAAFTAIGGGTVSVTDPNAIGTAPDNTIVTTTGTGLNVANTTIAAAGLTFTSIAVNGAPNGIVLNTTGTSGGLHVKGTGTTNSGGIIQNTTGDGMSLISTTDVQLDRMRVATTGGDGISGSAVHGFTLTNSTIFGAGDGDEENGIVFGNDNAGVGTVTSLGVDGTVLIQDVVIDGNNDSTQWGLRVYNKLDGATLNMKVLGLTVQNTDWTFGEDGVSIIIQDGTANVLFDDGPTLQSQFLTTGQSGITGQSGDSTTGELAVLNLTVQNSTFTNNYGLPAGLNFTTNGDGTGRYKVTGNTITGALAPSGVSGPSTQGIDFDAAIDSNLDAIVTNNTITMEVGTGLEAIANESSVLRFSASNNTINLDLDNSTPATQAGMNFQAREVLAPFTNAELHVTLSTNTISGITSGLFGFQGTNYQSGSSSSAPDTVTVCTNMSGNIVNGTAGLTAHSFRQRTGTTFQIQGLTPAAGATEGQVESWIQTTNPGGTLLGLTDVASAGGTTIVSYVAGTCQTPTTPALPPLLLSNGGVESVIASNGFGSNFATEMTGSNELSPTLLNIGSQPIDDPQLHATVAAAKQRWLATGLTGEQIAAMRELTFKVSDLSDSYLGLANGNVILVDRNAQGKGWFVDSTPLFDSEFGSISSATRRYTDPISAPAGHIDLLTAIEHEIGHKLGLDDSYVETDRDSLMYGYLTVGERRSPAPDQAKGAQPNALKGKHFLSLGRDTREKRSRATTAKNSAVHVAMALPPAVPTVTTSPVTLLAGKSVHVQFQVKVNAGFTGASVSNQGFVKYSGGPVGGVPTDDPNDATGTTDPTVTLVASAPGANDDTFNAFKDHSLDVPADGVLDNDDLNGATITSYGINGDEQTAIGTATPTAQGGSISLNADGSFAYTPLTGFTGADTFKYTLTNGEGDDTATVTINVEEGFINEVLFNPPGADAPNEYIELRGTPNAVIPAGTYFVVIDGDSGTAGELSALIDLSGLAFGSNGYLVLLQNGNNYTTTGGNVISSVAVDLKEGSVSFLLIQSAIPPTFGDDIDVDDDGIPESAGYGGWNVIDSIGVLDETTPAGGLAYAAINYANSAGAGTATGTTVSVAFTAAYVGRATGDTTGSAATDWVATGALAGGPPPAAYTLDGTNTAAASYAGRKLDHIGSTNFPPLNGAPVNTVPGTQNIAINSTHVFSSGNGNQISISDPDAGAADVKVTLTSTNGTMTLNGNTGLAFTTGDGTADASMVFTGTIININNALNGMSFTPTLNFSGAASIQIVTDDQGNTGAGGAQTDTDSVTINVAPNTPPTANAQSVTTAEDTPKAITLTGSDFETPSGSLTFTIVSGPSNGSLSPGGTGASQTYTPTANYNGPDSFTFKVNDGMVDSSPATVSINVTEVNDAPTANGETIGDVAEDSGQRTISFATLTANDSKGPADESGQALIVKTVGSAVGGTVSISGGNVLFTPTANFNGSASFQYTVEDNGTTNLVADPKTSGSATASFNVTPVADTPSVTPATTDANVQSTNGLVITRNAVDGVEVTHFKITSITGGTLYQNNGTTQINDGDFITVAQGGAGLKFTPTLNSSANGSFQVQASLNATNGGLGGGLATATITVNPLPTISITNVSHTEGDTGTTNFTFDVTLSAASTLTVTVDYVTADGTTNPATAPSDYTALATNTLTFTPGQLTKPVTVTVNGDYDLESDETFFVNLSTPVNATIADNQGLGTILNDDAAGGTFVFGTISPVFEDTNFVDVTVKRNGAKTLPVTVDYSTSDTGSTATERKDYTTAIGSVAFAAGEDTKTFRVLVEQDSATEGSESVQITLSNATGGAILGVPQNATLQINDAVAPLPDALSNTRNFVRRHYHDFLNREPDTLGFDFWTNDIDSCGVDANCRQVKRINVSAAFFLSIEFQETGFFAIRSHRVGFGQLSESPTTRMTYNELLHDTRQIGEGVVIPDFVRLEQNKQAYAQQIVTSSAFTTRFPQITAADYIDGLYSSAGVTPIGTERQDAIDAYNNAAGGTTEKRAAGFRKVVDSNSVRDAEFRQAFVLMEYYGYLRRSPDQPGYDYWLNKLNSFNGNYIQAEMVRAFIESIEYRERYIP